MWKSAARRHIRERWRCTPANVCIKVILPRQRERGKRSPTSSIFIALFIAIYPCPARVLRASDLCPAKKVRKGIKNCSYHYLVWFCATHFIRTSQQALNSNEIIQIFDEFKLKFLKYYTTILDIPPWLRSKLHFPWEAFSEDFAARVALRILAAENQLVCFETKSVREFVCHRPRAQGSFPPSGDGSGRFSIRSLGRCLEEDDCARRADRHRLSRLVFSNFRVLETPRDSLRTQPNPLLWLHAQCIQPHAVWLLASEVFSLTRKKFHRLARKIFSKRLNRRRKETMTGLLCTIGHVPCLSKPPTGWSTMQV